MPLNDIVLQKRETEFCLIYWLLLGVGNNALIHQTMYITIKKGIQKSYDVIVHHEEGHQHYTHDDF